MFTGLVLGLGTVKRVVPFGNGRSFVIDVAALGNTLAVGQSVAVNGACLTVTALASSEASFDAVSETVSRTNLGMLRAGDKVNLEPALKAGDALDGHIMLGHVDVLAKMLAVDASNPDNRVLRIELPTVLRHLVAEKGSIAVDGISLTVANAGADWFTIAVIPHTWSNSTLSRLNVGDGVNLEVDVLARYAARILQYGAPGGGGDGVTEGFLREHGFL